MKARRPDERGMRPDPGRTNMEPEGFPGQLGLLAQQMNAGFGGGVLAHQRNLRSIYDPVEMPGTDLLGGGGIQGEGLGPNMQETLGKLSPWLQSQQIGDQRQFMDTPTGAGDWPGKVNMFKDLNDRQKRAILEQFMQQRRGMTQPNLGTMWGSK